MSGPDDEDECSDCFDDRTESEVESAYEAEYVEDEYYKEDPNQC